MRLSICMMVKDEEKNLRRCLDSLKYLRENIDSELIIVDTGSTDMTVEIAKEYTDRVYFHPWNNDFSAMRNITIDYSKGEWIFIIDADEELVEGVEDLVVLFNTKEIEKFNVVGLMLKDILSRENPENITLMPTARIFRNDGHFRYEGRVHNRPICKPPGLQIKSILAHYGYDKDDRELIEKKFKRTSQLLIEELDKNPKDIYYNYQLGKSYAMHREPKKALDQLIKAYEFLKEKNYSNEKLKNLVYVHGTLAVFCFNDERYEEALKICNEALEIENEYLDLYCVRGKCYSIKGEYEKAISDFKTYFNLLNNIDKLNVVKNHAVELITINGGDAVSYELYNAYYKLGNYEEAFNSIVQIGFGRVKKDFLKQFVEVAVKCGRFNELSKVYENICTNEEVDIKNVFAVALENNIMGVQKSNFIEFLKHFAGEKDEYALLNKARLVCETEDNGTYVVISNALKALDLYKLPDFYGDIIYFALFFKIELQDTMQKISEVKLDRLLNYVRYKYSNFFEVTIKYLNNIEHSDLISMKLSKMLTRVLLSFEDIEDELYKKVFIRYLDSGINYLDALYKNDILKYEMIYELKNDEEIFLLYMYKAERVYKDNELEYIKCLRKALEVAPMMKKGIELILAEINNKKNFQITEMENLKIEFKRNISQLIQVGNLDEAEIAISEYEKIVPDDIESILFKSEIEIKKVQQ